MYFVGRNPLGKPVHIEGQVLDSRKEVAKIETGQQGMGVFQFTPQAGEKYTVKIDKPLGITNRPELPRADRIVTASCCRPARGFSTPGSSDCSARYFADKADVPLVVSAYCRGMQVGSKAVTRPRASGSAA